ncbi:MAG: hypothetical protein EA377_07685 [Phycisphaerales bacterium]|nr:MAG: hypothetical protein EA377_07685 [Phycisphaerales bacterium]
MIAALHPTPTEQTGSFHRARLISAALLLLSFTSFGCESAPRASADRESTTQRAEASDDALSSPSDSSAGSSSGLAELAQRDVEAFLNQRGDRRSSQRDEPAEPAEPAQHEPVREARADRPEIIWNDRNAPSTRPDRRTAQRPSEREATPPALARAEDELEDVSDPPLDKTPSQEDGPEAADALDQDRVRQLVVDLSKELYRDAAYADMPLRELMLIAATSLVSPDRALQPEAIPGLTARERELLGAFQAFFVDLGHQLDGSRAADEVLDESLENLRRMLRTEPDLTIENVALCTRVGGFGDYDPFNRYAFLAHTDQQVVLYLELKNFTSETNQQGQWVTEISQQIIIYSDRDGIPVWREDWQTAVDVARNKRHDFFLVQVITLPRALSVGRYHMKVRARDEKSRAEAEATITFEIVADPKMAATVR